MGHRLSGQLHGLGVYVVGGLAQFYIFENISKFGRSLWRKKRCSFQRPYKDRPGQVGGLLLVLGVTLLNTLLITTHEPPSSFWFTQGIRFTIDQGLQAGGAAMQAQGCSLAWRFMGSYK